MADPPTERPDSVCKLIWKHRRVIFYCVLVSTGTLCTGFDATTLLPIPQFQQQFGQQQPDGTYIVPAMYQAVWNAVLIPGALLGAAISGFVGSWLGRRCMFLVGSLILMAGLMKLQMSTEWKGFAVGKFVQYMGGTFYGVGVPTYISEVAPPEIRGVLLTLVNLTLYIWLFVCSCAMYWTFNIPNRLSFHAIIMINYAIPMAVMGITWFVPEPPCWLLEKGLIERALKAAKKLYGEENVEEKIREVREDIAARASARKGPRADYLDCFRGVNRRRTLISCGILAGQQLAGMIFIFGYTTYFFTLAGIASTSSFILTVILTLLQLIAIFISWPLLERLGRRPLLITGAVVMLISLLITGGIGASPSYDKGIMPRIAVGCVFVFSLAFQFSVGSAGWAVAAEVSSLETRVATQGIAVAVNYTSCALVFLSVPYLIGPDAANLGLKVCFVFAFFAAATLAFVYFCVPEMRGRSIAEIEYMFRHKIAARKFEGFVVPTNQENSIGTVGSTPITQKGGENVELVELQG